jgi:hypothetical protein
VCKNDPDNFCYICGQFMVRAMRKIMSQKLKQAYNLYFGWKVGNEDKSWAPHYCCTQCYTALTQWLNGKRKSMPFAIPMIWHEQKNHLDDCYFCITQVFGHSSKTKSKIEYPNCQSAIRPVPHGDALPVPTPPADPQSLPPSSSEESEGEQSDVYESVGESSSCGHHLINQAELNDLVRDLSLSKQHAELLASRLGEWQLLMPGTHTSVFRNRHKKLSNFYSMADLICYCNDVHGLFNELGCHYKDSEWRLFIDSSKSSLKAVLLHNGNSYPSIPVAHAVGMKETYEAMQKLLETIKYSQHNWVICSDLKVVALLLGMQLGYTKHMCFLCLWDSRDESNHYVRKEWPARQEFIPGVKNIVHLPLVDPSKIILPPLHIKLGLMKNFVKAMKKDAPGFLYLQKKFSTISDAKLKAGVFTGPQIRETIKDQHFDNALSDMERSAWMSFKLVVTNFLGNNKSENSVQIINDLLHHYNAMGCRMSLKLHFLHSHLDFFPDNLGDLSDEHGERFHQDILSMEHRYQGRWDTAMMGDYCWFLQRESNVHHYRRKCRSSQHF